MRDDVAMYDGRPVEYDKERMEPLVEVASRAREFAASEYRMSPMTYVARPVPPYVGPIAVPFHVPLVIVPNDVAPVTDNAPVICASPCS